MGRFAMGNSALGFSSALVVKVVNDEPGPHKMRACRPGAAMETAWGMATVAVVVVVSLSSLSPPSVVKVEWVGGGGVWTMSDVRRADTNP